MEINLTPLISFYMTVKDGESVVADAINSVLDQTYYNLELIVVDDGSRDNTIQVVKGVVEKDSRVKLIESGGVGRAKALNLAINNTKGEYLFNLDADDYAHPRRAELQILFMKNNNEEFVASRGLIVYGSERPVWTDQGGADNCDFDVVNKSIAYKNSINHSSVAFSRKLLYNFENLYDERRIKQIDNELWIRLSINGVRLNLLDKRLSAKRIHAGQSYENKDRSRYVWSSFCLKFSASRKMSVAFWVYPYLFLKLFYGLAPQRLRMVVKGILK